MKESDSFMAFLHVIVFVATLLWAFVPAEERLSVAVEETATVGPLVQCLRGPKEHREHV